MFLHLYKASPLVAFLVNCIGFFLWAMTLILIMVVLAVALAG